MTSSCMIRSTNMEYVSMDEVKTRSTFVSAYNQVFPLSIEEQYVALTNLIFAYCATCRVLKEQDEQLYAHILGLRKAYNILDHLGTLESIQASLQDAVEALNKKQTSEAYQKVIDIANCGKEACVAKSEIKSLNDERFKSEEWIAIEREELAGIVARISITLQAISALNVDGQRAIDGLSVSQDHLSAFDNLDISLLEKEAAKREFVSYFDMRCTAFKYVEELAEKIVAAYSKREILDGLGKDSDGEMDKELEGYMIALKTLSAFPHCNRPLGVVHESLCAAINADCDMIDHITEYLKTSTLDREGYLNALGSLELDVHICELAADVWGAIQRIRTTSLQRK